jgi:hypothetical protein
MILVPGKLYKLTQKMFWYIGEAPNTSTMVVPKNSIIMIVSIKKCETNIDLNYTTIHFLYKENLCWANSTPDFHKFLEQLTF